MEASTGSVPRSRAQARRIGRYEVLAELARGGTGIVYLGRLVGPGGFERLFAIKVLHAHLSEQEELIQLLLAEARVAAQIRHQNVVGTLEVDINPDGQHYLVMDLVDGVSLSELLDHPTIDPLVRMRLGISMVCDALSGLAAAHRAVSPTTGNALHIVHRDVTPGNVLIGLDGVGRLADFGIARAAGARPAEGASVSGTPAYMSPEQAMGRMDLDLRTDIFSMGVVLWEVLTGTQLFGSAQGAASIMEAVVNAEPPPPSRPNPRVPPELDRICLRALEKRPEDRYQRAPAFRDALVDAARMAGLLASADDVSDAIHALFADRIAERRALLVGADPDEHSSVQRLPTGGGAGSPHTLIGVPGAPDSAPPDVPADVSAADDPDAVTTGRRRRGHSATRTQLGMTAVGAEGAPGDPFDPEVTMVIDPRDLEPVEPADASSAPHDTISIDPAYARLTALSSIPPAPARPPHRAPTGRHSIRARARGPQRSGAERVELDLPPGLGGFRRHQVWLALAGVVVLVTTVVTLAIHGDFRAPGPDAPVAPLEPGAR